jgi:diguanylate cyclase (GGDEF)-like protein
VADRLRGGARSHDVVARLAGDEFVVLLTDLPRSGAVEVAERFAERVRAALAEPFELGGSHFSTSASIGVAVYPEHASDARSLVKAADTSMYASKRVGAGRVSVAGARADAA